MVWIVLFSILIILSFISNLTLIIAVLSNPRKRTCVHLLICFLFVVNLTDYALLVLEFSLGVSSHFPWGEDTCSVYQYLHQSTPLYYVAILGLLVYYARKSSSSAPVSLVWSLLPVVPVVLLLSLPTILFAGTAVYPSGARYCVMDLSGVAAWAGIEAVKRQTATALYYLIYRSVLPYLLPLALVVPSLIKLYSSINGPEDKNSVVSLTLAVVCSYFVFYSCYSVTAFIRHGIELTLVDISPRASWLLAVLQSLFALLATFQHVFRPLLCFVLDIDLRKDLVSRLKGRGGRIYQVVQQSSSANLV